MRKPRYEEICVGESNCVPIGSCDDVPIALERLGLNDDAYLVELVMKAVCGGEDE